MTGASGSVMPGRAAKSFDMRAKWSSIGDSSAKPGVWTGAMAGPTASSDCASSTLETSGEEVAFVASSAMTPPALRLDLRHRAISRLNWTMCSSTALACEWLSDGDQRQVGSSTRAAEDLSSACSDHWCTRGWSSGAAFLSSLSARPASRKARAWRKGRKLGTAEGLSV